MAKFYGPIGYVETQETRPGIHQENVTERNYSGDVFRSVRKLASGESIIDDVTVNNSLSIVADPYAYQHFFAIRYVKWMGAYWKVTNVEVQNPRLLLTIGGVYNGPTA